MSVIKTPSTGSNGKERMRMTDKIFKVTFTSQVILPEEECQEAMKLFLHGDSHLINMMLDNAHPASAKIVKIKKVRE